MNVACNSPDTVSHRVSILLELQRLWMLLKVHSIELHAKLLRGCALARTWARWHARGPDTSRVDPVVCAWVRWYACGRRPGAYLGVDVRVTGLTRMFSGSRASDTPGQAPLCSQRRPPCPRHAIVSVCYRSGLHCGRHTTPRRDLTALNRDLTALNRGLTALNRDLTALNRDLTAPRRGLTGSKRGNCASRGRMRDLLADDCAIKWGELHH